jgi:pyruvate formate lyase activating enzyme
LCYRHCLLEDGQTGFCLARANEGGVLNLLNYGQVSGLALDPIEKKPLRRFMPGTHILSIGFYGCNMDCAYCQNHMMSRTVPEKTRYISPEELVELAIMTKPNIGVAFTYNEPLISIDYILDAAPLIREAGLKLALVTNGVVEEKPLRDLLPYIDAVNVDLKRFNVDAYGQLGGDLDSVKRTIKILAGSTHLEVTTLVVPGLNDAKAEMELLSAWLASVDENIPLHLSRFFPNYRMEDAVPTPIERMHVLADIAALRLKYVFLGNV